ncbi:MAG: prepilin-type N-terminal cleavage/methylation domain-containing protein [Gammaproteobacteria bacterium]|jgi:prepilin-type N-terminal cleavage/methylation domain-containing protein|nr:prepilin-type N-terminal cleavage/methylation domain-containing protein [Gammaproteobacteria bacterium]
MQLKTIRGFTLVEFVLALTVIGIGAAILTSFVTPTAGSADPMIQAQARAIAAGYMDEILLRKHDEDPGDCAGGRGDWASIRCYDGLDEPPTDQFGNPIAALSDYRVTVAVSGSAPAGIAVNVSHVSGSVDYALQSRRGAY